MKTGDIVASEGHNSQFCVGGSVVMILKTALVLSFLGVVLFAVQQYLVA